MNNSDNECNPQNDKQIINPKIIELIKDLNINTKTLLSTDYLNHFNEIVMMIAMIPEMPEIIDDCKEWQTKNYIQHFADSSLSYKDIAIELYKKVPFKTRDAFEKTIEQTNNIIIQTIERLDLALQNDTPKQIAQKVEYSQKALQALIDITSGIIHGSEKALTQEEIDKL